jgi:hypothetical protein
VKAVLEDLISKGFWWCLLNKDKIDAQIVGANDQISDAFRIFNVGHLIFILYEELEELL